jgi:WD40 repeat protein
LDSWRIGQIAFSPDGQLLAVGREKSVEFRGAADPQELSLEALPGIIRDIALSPDNHRLACASGEDGAPGEVSVWDIATGQKVLSLHGHAGVVYCVTFSPDGRFLAAAGAGATIKVWDAATGREICTLRCNEPVRS